MDIAAEQFCSKILRIFRPTEESHGVGGVRIYLMES